MYVHYAKWKLAVKTILPLNENYLCYSHTWSSLIKMRLLGKALHVWHQGLSFPVLFWRFSPYVFTFPVAVRLSTIYDCPYVCHWCLVNLTSLGYMTWCPLPSPLPVCGCQFFVFYYVPVSCIFQYCFNVFFQCFEFATLCLLYWIFCALWDWIAFLNLFLNLTLN